MTSPEPLLTPREAADRLGITPSLVYRYMSQGRLPHIKHYGRLLIHPDALAEFAKLPRKVGKRAKAHTETQS